MENGFQKMEQLVANVRDVNLTEKLSEDEYSEDGILTISESGTDSGLSITSTMETIFNDELEEEEVDDEKKESEDKAVEMAEAIIPDTSETLTDKVESIVNKSIEKMLNLQMSKKGKQRTRITGPGPEHTKETHKETEKETQIEKAKAIMAMFEAEGFSGPCWDTRLKAAESSGASGYRAIQKRCKERRGERNGYKPYERVAERVAERSERKSDPQWKRIMSDKSGIESIRRRLNKFGEDQNAFGQCLHFIKEETKQRLKNGNLEINKLTTEKVSQFRPCQFFQIKKCRQTMYSGVHLDRNFEVNKKAYVHGCSLCHKLFSGIVEHSMSDCMIVAELDTMDENKSYQPKILRRINNE